MDVVGHQKWDEKGPSNCQQRRWWLADSPLSNLSYPTGKEALRCPTTPSPTALGYPLAFRPSTLPRPSTPSPPRSPGADPQERQKKFQQLRRRFRFTASTPVFLGDVGDGSLQFSGQNERDYLDQSAVSHRFPAWIGRRV